MGFENVFLKGSPEDTLLNAETLLSFWSVRTRHWAWDCFLFLMVFNNWWEELVKWNRFPFCFGSLLVGLVPSVFSSGTVYKLLVVFSDDCLECFKWVWLLPWSKQESSLKLVFFCVVFIDSIHAVSLVVCQNEYLLMVHLKWNARCQKYKSYQCQLETSCSPVYIYIYASNICTLCPTIPLNYLGNWSTNSMHRI